MSYTLPQTQDFEGDSVTIAQSGSYPHFVTFSENKLTFAPLLGDAGNYSVKVALTDNNVSPLSSIVSIYITVTANEEGIEE